jgi:hypothetical protein
MSLKPAERPLRFWLRAKRRASRAPYTFPIFLERTQNINRRTDTAYKQELKVLGGIYCSPQERKPLIGTSLPWLPCLTQVMIIRTLRCFKTGSQT